MKISERQTKRYIQALKNRINRIKQEEEISNLAWSLIPYVYRLQLDMEGGKVVKTTWSICEDEEERIEQLSHIPKHIVQELLDRWEKTSIEVAEQRAQRNAEKRKKWGLLDKILPSL